MRLTLKEYGYLVHALELARNHEKDEEEWCRINVLLSKVYDEYEELQEVALIS